MRLHDMKRHCVMAHAEGCVFVISLSFRTSISALITHARSRCSCMSNNKSKTTSNNYAKHNFSLSVVLLSSLRESNLLPGVIWSSPLCCGAACAARVSPLLLSIVHSGTLRSSLIPLLPLAFFLRARRLCIDSAWESQSSSELFRCWKGAGHSAFRWRSGPCGRS